MCDIIFSDGIVVAIFVVVGVVVLVESSIVDDIFSILLLLLLMFNGDELIAFKDSNLSSWFMLRINWYSLPCNDSHPHTQRSRSRFKSNHTYLKTGCNKTSQLQLLIPFSTKSLKRTMQQELDHMYQKIPTFPRLRSTP